MNAPPVFLARNGLAVVTKQSSKQFLLSSPRGAYTTARTVEQRRIFEFDRHLDRLSETTRLMLVDDGADVTPKLRAHLTKSSDLREKVLMTTLTALRGFTEQYPTLLGERKITLLLTWSSEELDVFAHVAELPPRPCAPIEVQIHGAPRSNAKAKDSKWVYDRQKLEGIMTDHVNELILSDENGDLPEGTQTNFFVVNKDGAVVTAPDDGTILAGTVRGIVLDMCALAGVPVDLSAPNISDVATWQEAFIASTSRLVLPIDYLQMATSASGIDSPCVSRTFKAHPISERLLSMVRSELHNRSIDVFDDA